MAQHTQDFLLAAQTRIDRAFQKYPWFAGSYVGFEPGANQAAPAIIVNTLPGDHDAEQKVRELAGEAPVRIVKLLDRPTAY
jgi:hypothetical protein